MSVWHIHIYSTESNRPPPYDLWLASFGGGLLREELELGAWTINSRLSPISTLTKNISLHPSDLSRVMHSRNSWNYRNVPENCMLEPQEQLELQELGEPQGTVGTSGTCRNCWNYSTEVDFFRVKCVVNCIHEL